MYGNEIDKDLLKVVRSKYGLIGSSPAMMEAIEKLALAAPTDLTVLITGETGTGKEVFANAVHGLSTRRKNQFISVNCGAIPETLLESELFGHEKGAFTGATEQRKGFFEVADKGTIFLDEIGEMPVGTQVKLLRVLESGEFTRLGSTVLRKVDVRVIAATNRELEKEVEQGTFRRDLFFRLNSVQIILPPLRNHIEDIPEYIDNFAKKSCEKLGLKYDGVSADALDIMKSLPWQGNIRELKNLIETLVTLEQETYIDAHILRKYIPKALPSADYSNTPLQKSIVAFNRVDDNQSFGMEIIFRTLLEMKHEFTEIKQMLLAIGREIEAMKVDIINEKNTTFQSISNDDIPQIQDDNINLAQIEKQMIIFALNKHKNSRRNAARDLGISERTLYRKLIEYDLGSLS